MLDTLETNSAATETETNPPEINGDDLRRAAETLDRAAHNIDDSLDSAGIKSVVVSDDEVALGNDPTSAPVANDASTPLADPVAPMDQPASTVKSPTTTNATEKVPTLDEFLTHWNKDLASLHKEHPELLDKKSALYKTVESYLLNEDLEVRRIFHSSTKGARYALQLAQVKLEADKSSGLLKENAALKARIKEQDRKLAPSAGIPAAGPRGKNFDQLNFEEQGAFLRRLALEEDGLV